MIRRKCEEERPWLSCERKRHSQVKWGEEAPGMAEGRKHLADVEAWRKSDKEEENKSEREETKGDQISMKRDIQEYLKKDDVKKRTKRKIIISDKTLKKSH